MKLNYFQLLSAKCQSLITSAMLTLCNRSQQHLRRLYPRTHAHSQGFNYAYENVVAEVAPLRDFKTAWNCGKCVKHAISTMIGNQGVKFTLLMEHTSYIKTYNC